MIICFVFFVFSFQSSCACCCRKHGVKCPGSSKPQVCEWCTYMTLSRQEHPHTQDDTARLNIRISVVWSISSVCCHHAPHSTGCPIRAVTNCPTHTHAYTHTLTGVGRWPLMHHYGNCACTMQMKEPDLSLWPTSKSVSCSIKTSGPWHCPNVQRCSVRGSQFNVNVKKCCTAFCPRQHLCFLPLNPACEFVIH